MTYALVAVTVTVTASAPLTAPRPERVKEAV
jgi:hypothetical protein